MYYGENSGSGAFTLGGFNPTRVINARGDATDTVYDDAYRAIRTIRRHDGGTGIDSTAAARSDEPETDTVYNNDGKPVEVTVRNEAGDRNTYTFYDAFDAADGSRGRHERQRRRIRSVIADANQ
jgi:hypothetical protein